jgi:hypothetical protein
VSAQRSRPKFNEVIGSRPVTIFGPSCIRRARAVLAADYNPDGMPDDGADEARRVAEAIDCARPI